MIHNNANLTAVADYHILHKALKWLEQQNVLPDKVLKHADVLNAEKLGLSPGEVCRAWI